MIRPAPLRLGTRGSLLARTQSGMVAQALRAAHPDLDVQLITISTTGDRVTDRPLADAGGKGLFTKELELALLAGEIDAAVHSLKDVPVTMPLVDQSGLELAAIPLREDSRDVLVCRHAKTLADLPAGAKIGTGSLRRRCQILHARPDLAVWPLRGNVDTRLRKLEAGEVAAIVLAMAGLKRLGLFDPSFMHPIDPAQLLPAAGQGALALQCRSSDEPTQSRLRVLHHKETAQAVRAERGVVAALNGDCHSPIAAQAIIEADHINLLAAVGQNGGEPPVRRCSATAPRESWERAVQAVAQTLQSPPPII